MGVGGWGLGFKGFSLTLMTLLLLALIRSITRHASILATVNVILTSITITYCSAWLLGPDALLSGYADPQELAPELSKCYPNLSPKTPRLLRIQCASGSLQA